MCPLPGQAMGETDHDAWIGGGVRDRKEGERNYIQGVKGNEREKCQECEPGSWAGSTEPRLGSAEPAGMGRNRLLESQG